MRVSRARLSPSVPWDARGPRALPAVTAGGLGWPWARRHDGHPRRKAPGGGRPWACPESSPAERATVTEACGSRGVTSAEPPGLGAPPAHWLQLLAGTAAGLGRSPPPPPGAGQAGHRVSPAAAAWEVKPLSTGLWAEPLLLPAQHEAAVEMLVSSCWRGSPSITRPRPPAAGGSAGVK